MRADDDAMPLRVRCVVALVLGVLLAAGLQPLAWWPLAFVCVGTLTWLCRGLSLPAGALCGGIFGLAFVVACMWWLHVIVPGAQFLVAAAEVPFFALLGVGLAASCRIPGWPLWAACCWTGAEALRGHVPLGGLPWGRLSVAAVDTPLVSWARYVGEAGMTFVVALVSALLASAVVTAAGRGAARRRLSTTAVAVVSALLLVGAGGLLPVGVSGGVSGVSGGGRAVTVAVVQGDVPGSGLDAFFAPRVTLRNHVRETHRLAADVRAGRVPQPDVVVWPENASDVDPFLDPSAAASIQAAVDDVDAPVVVGAVTSGPGPDDVQGTGVVWRPGAGPGDRYAKRRLVPFGEWVPFRTALTPLVPLLEEEIPRDFVPGDGPGVLSTGPVVVGAVMCFEIAYDSAVRAVAGAGVDVLAVQTNNATYMGSGQLEQQWAITRLRAVETGRAVAVAATTGISGVIAPDGSVVRRTHSRAPASIVADVPAAEGATPGVLWGGWVEVVVSVVAAAVVLAGVWPPTRRGRRRG